MFRVFVVSFCLMVTMLCVAVLAAAGAYTFNNVLEARRDMIRKEQSDKMIATIEEIGEKIPDFNFFKRRQENAEAASGSGRMARRFSR